MVAPVIGEGLDSVFTPEALAEDREAAARNYDLFDTDADAFIEKSVVDSPPDVRVPALQQNMIEPDKAVALSAEIDNSKAANQPQGIGLVPALMAGIAGIFSEPGKGVETASKLMKEWDPARQEAVRVKREAAAGKASGEATARQRDLDMNDPESALSARSRDFFTKNIPGAGVDGMSAADLKRLMPDMWKASGLEMRGAEFEESKRARGETEGYRKEELGMRQKRIDADRDIAEQKRTREDERKDLKESRYVTPGAKSTDVAFGKDYNDWTTGGRATYTKERDALDAAFIKLEEAQTETFGRTSGNIEGRLPDWLRTAESREIQQQVEQAAVGMLRATLGSAFTEKEGERIMKLSYDPTQEPAVNMKKVKAAIAEMEARKDALESKSKYWEANEGSLQGWKRNEGAPAGGTVKVRSPDGKVGSIPAENLQRALDAGYTEI